MLIWKKILKVKKERELKTRVNVDLKKFIESGKRKRVKNKTVIR